MRKIPVIAIIRDAYAFTFAHLGAIIGLIWLPMVLITVGQFFVGQHAGAEMEQAVAAGNPSAAGPALLVVLLFYLAALALYAMIFTAVTQFVLGQRQGGALVHFTFGALEWRVFRTLFGVMLFLMPGYLLLAISAGGGAAPGGAPAGVASITALALVCAMIFFMVRLTGVILPVLASDEKSVLMRSWSLTAGNFWRLLGVFLGLAVPVFLLVMLIVAAAIGSQIAPGGGMPTPEEVRALSERNQPLLAGLGFLVAPLHIGLLTSASVFCWRALTRTDISA